MSFSFTENWDSVTPPALPANWNADAALITSTSQAYTSPNSLTLNDTSSVKKYATYTVSDPSGGSVATASAKFRAQSGSPVGMITNFGITLRCSSSTMDNSSTSCYWIYLAFDTSALYSTLYVAKIVNGTVTNLASQQNTDQTINFGTWYELSCMVNGSLFNVSLKRFSDNYYMDSGGNFTNTSPTFAIPSFTNSDISSGNYFGLCASANRATRLFMDDGSVSSGPLVLPPRNPVIVRTPFQYYHPD